jgi:predicted dehydrogenase
MATIGCHLIDLVSFILGSPATMVCADFTTVHPVRRRPRAPDNGSDQGPGSFDDVPIDAEEAASCLVRFASGAKAILGVSRVTAGRRYQISLAFDGTAAALAWDSESPNHLWIGHHDRPNELLLRDPALMSAAARSYTSYIGAYQEAFADTMKGLIGAVYDRIRHGGDGPPDYPTFVDGHGAILVHEAVLESVRSGGWVEVRAVAAVAPLTRRPG